MDRLFILGNRFFNTIDHVCALFDMAEEFQAIEWEHLIGRRVDGHSFAHHPRTQSFLESVDLELKEDLKLIAFNLTDALRSQFGDIDKVRVRLRCSIDLWSDTNFGVALVDGVPDNWRKENGLLAGSFYKLAIRQLRDNFANAIQHQSDNPLLIIERFYRFMSENYGDQVPFEALLKECRRLIHKIGGR